MHGFKPVKLDYVTTAHPIPNAPPDFDMKLEKRMFEIICSFYFDLLYVKYVKSNLQINFVWYYNNSRC